MSVDVKLDPKHPVSFANWDFYVTDEAGKCKDRLISVLEKTLDREFEKIEKRARQNFAEAITTALSGDEFGRSAHVGIPWGYFDKGGAEPLTIQVNLPFNTDGAFCREPFFRVSLVDLITDAMDLDEDPDNLDPIDPTHWEQFADALQAQVDRVRAAIQDRRRNAPGV